MIIIKIDCREAQLYDELSQIIDINIERVNLELGDIIIESDDPAFSLVFERKTQSDLSASLKDGRYREQKVRLLGNYPAHHCSYIIEGKVPIVSQSIYEGVIYHTMYRDKMHILLTDNIHETAKTIKQIYEKCIAHPDKFVATNTNTDYVANLKIKSRKAHNIDKKTCFILQLSQIPGISHTIAQAIATRYPTWNLLISEMNNENSNREKNIAILSSIPLIGTKKANIILDYIS
jgi:ERCC4-type nuclease